MKQTIGFIGCGNMGSALIKAAAKAEKAGNIFLTDCIGEKAATLAWETGANAVTAKEIAEKCGMIFLGVKPQGMAALLDEIKGILEERKDHFVLVSMAAGMTISALKALSGDFPYIRMMPNLPVAVGEGVILYASEDATEDDIVIFENLLRHAGLLSPVDEATIEAGCALTGCGPAYAAMMVEALADAGVFCGLQRKQAQMFAAQTLLGTARTLLENDMHPGELKDAVCSPGGTTIEGVLSLERNGFRAAVSDAVLAGYNKKW